jgi:hypothetical protein
VGREVSGTSCHDERLFPWASVVAKARICQPAPHLRSSSEATMSASVSTMAKSVLLPWTRKCKETSQLFYAGPPRTHGRLWPVKAYAMVIQ